MSHFGEGKRTERAAVGIVTENILNVLHFANLAKCASRPTHCVCQLLWGLISIAVLEMDPVQNETVPYFARCLVGQHHAPTEIDSSCFRKPTDRE